MNSTLQEVVQGQDHCVREFAGSWGLHDTPLKVQVLHASHVQTCFYEAADVPRDLVESERQPLHVRRELDDAAQAGAHAAGARVQADVPDGLPKLTRALEHAGDGVDVCGAGDADRLVEEWRADA